MKIVFVCTGNTCRSPIAEGLLKKIASDKGMAVDVCSRGVSVSIGSKVSENSILAAKKYGVDISNHVPTLLTAEDIFESDYIFTMTVNHRDLIIAYYPEHKNKIYSISEFCDVGDICDPFGGDEAVYDICAKEIDRACKKITEKIFGHEADRV